MSALTDLRDAVLRGEWHEVFPPKLLRDFLEYDPETGRLFWLPRTAETCANHAQWNATHVGKPALTAPKNSGHLHGLLFRKPLMAHRAAWTIYYGEWPMGWLDHINGIRADNRIVNLRLVSPLGNAQNRRPNKGKSSGLPHGVSRKKNGRLYAQIQANRTHHHLGYFETVEEAEAAYRHAAERLGFHENHGLNALIAEEGK